MPAWVWFLAAWVFGPLLVLVLLELRSRLTDGPRRDFDRWETEMWT